MKKLIRKILARLRAEASNEELVALGMKIGKNFSRQEQTIIDQSHCWLIEIGDDVTIAPKCHILAHDASTKSRLGFTRLGKVKIGNNVFIGAGSIILPGVSIGNNVVIGAGSIVSRDIPSNCLAVGAPAKTACSYDEYLEKKSEEIKAKPRFSVNYTLPYKITPQQKEEMLQLLDKEKIGYVRDFKTPCDDTFWQELKDLDTL